MLFATKRPDGCEACCADKGELFLVGDMMVGCAVLKHTSEREINEMKHASFHPSAEQQVGGFNVAMNEVECMHGFDDGDL